MAYDELHQEWPNLIVLKDTYGDRAGAGTRIVLLTKRSP